MLARLGTVALLREYCFLTLFATTGEVGPSTGNSSDCQLSKGPPTKKRHPEPGQSSLLSVAVQAYLWEQLSADELVKNFPGHQQQPDPQGDTSLRLSEDSDLSAPSEASELSTSTCKLQRACSEPVAAPAVFPDDSRIAPSSLPAAMPLQHSAGAASMQHDGLFITSTGSRIPCYTYSPRQGPESSIAPVHGWTLRPALQLARLDELKALLSMRADELKRPVMAISRTEAQIEEEQVALKQLQRGLLDVEKKLKVLQNISNAPNRMDDKMRLFTGLDACRERLLQQARSSEATAFVSKDALKAIIDFCTVKNSSAQGKPGAPGGPNIDVDTLSSKPSAIPKFPRSASNSGRDDRPLAHVDQSEGRHHLQATPSGGIPSFAASHTPAPSTPTAGGGGLRTPLAHSLSAKSRPSLQLPSGSQPVATPTQHTQDQVTVPQGHHSGADTSQSPFHTMVNLNSDDARDLAMAGTDAVASVQASSGAGAAAWEDGRQDDYSGVPAMLAQPSRIRRLSRTDSEGDSQGQPAGLTSAGSGSSLVRDNSGRLPSGIPSYRDSAAPTKSSAGGPPLVPRLRLGMNADGSSNGGANSSASGTAPPGSPSAASSLMSPVTNMASPRLPPDAVDSSQPTNIFKSMSMNRGSGGGAPPRLQPTSSVGTAAMDTQPSGGSGVAAAWRAREQGSTGNTDAGPGPNAAFMSRISSFNSGSSGSNNSLARAGAGNGLGSRPSAGVSLKPTASATMQAATAAAPPSPGAAPAFKLRPLTETRSAMNVPPAASSPVSTMREQLKSVGSGNGADTSSMTTNTNTTKPSPITAAAAIAKAVKASPADSPLASAASEPAELTAEEQPLRPAPSRAAATAPPQAVAQTAAAAIARQHSAEEQQQAVASSVAAPPSSGSAGGGDGDGVGAPRRITDSSEELLMASPLIKHFATRRVGPGVGSSLPPAVMAAGPQVAHTGLINAPARYQMPARLVQSSGGVNGMDLMMMMEEYTNASVGDGSDEGLMDGDAVLNGSSQDRDAWLRGRRRGPWGMVLKVVGVATTAVTLAAATGIAIFAAAAVNSGLDELDDMQGGRKPQRRKAGKGRKGTTPLLPFFPPAANTSPHDKLAAGRG